MTRDELILALAALDAPIAVPASRAMLERAFPDREIARRDLAPLGGAAAASLLAASALTVPFLRPSPADITWSENLTRVGQDWLDQVAASGFLSAPKSNNPFPDSDLGPEEGVRDE